eukprot:Seg1067.7 transcript_id=Seg1067.7/GoldUCD/mRNA.D3Y31 product="hypothetical protein" protein_id=Seg1067.7/GoldUCD/D3Y31
MFCLGCGDILQNDRCDKCEKESDTNELITKYFHRGYQYQFIARFMERDGIKMSVRTLKRKLKAMNLRRKNSIDFEDQDHIRRAIRNEMSGPGSLGGYRTIWHALRLRHQLHVPRSFVANVMKEIDPAGVEARKKRKLRRRTFFSEGPNYSWHADGYDKLKPYGFPVHGAIDGFSRRILWLEVVRSTTTQMSPQTYSLNPSKR